MTEQSDRKESTKTALRAVLNSTPNCLPLSRLEADYEKCTGGPIPYRAMGYISLAEFIKDIPDVIECWMSYGQLMTKAVAVPSTERITSLVARQRNRTQPRNIAQHPKPREKRQSPKPVSSSSEYHILRGKIKELLYAYKDGIALSKFPDAFAKRFGQYMNPDNYGFAQISDLLESMNDIIDLKPCSDDLIVHIKCGTCTTFQG